MARYLVVAHQTSESPEFIEALEELATTDPDAEFVLVIPATPVKHLAVVDEARQRYRGSPALFDAGWPIRYPFITGG